MSIAVSPQARSIYQILIKAPPLSAKEIGNRLNIFPHAVYRAIKPLCEVGVVEQLNSYPVRYQSATNLNGIDEYIFSLRNSILSTYLPKGIHNNSNTERGLNIKFIQNRQQLLNYSSADIRKAKRDVHHIVSGLEIPAETIFEIKNAAERKVKIKFIVQRLDEVNLEMLKNWQKIGIEVKYFHLLEARIIIIDEEIVYITSYNPKNQDEAFGIRFQYTPIARLMNELFVKHWLLGKKI